MRQRIRLDKPQKKEQEQNTSKIELDYEVMDSKTTRWKPYDKQDKI